MLYLCKNVYICKKINKLIMPNFVKSYSKEQEDKVIELFNRGLRKGETIVDNRDKTIAKEVGISTEQAGVIVSKYLEKKFRLLNIEINKNENN